MRYIPLLIAIVAFVFPPSLNARDDGRFAQAPDNVKKWFKSLRRPHSDISCCDESDCTRTEFEMTTKGYRAVVFGKWVDIPPEVVINNVGNPTGEAVVCARQGYGPSGEPTVYCFVPGGGV